MFDTIDFSHRMRVVRAQLQRSARSSRQVKLVEASVKGPTVLRNAGFYGGVVAAYVFTEKMAGGIRGVYDSWNAVPAALAAGVGIGIRAGSVPVAAGMTGGILGLKYVLQGSGAEVQPKDAGAYYYYGDGETGRERWLAKNAEERATWLKAPFVRLHSLTFILRLFLAHHFPPFSHDLRLDTTISETQSPKKRGEKKKRLISETHGFLWNRSIRTQRATATTTS